MKPAVCTACGHKNPGQFRFCGHCGASLQDSAHPSHTLADRRQLTTLFCDLVGSTVIANRLDPEDFENLLNRYCTTCATVIEQFYGYVARYVGDGILAYFGYPHAREDAAACALHAALGIIDALATLPPPPTGPLAVRIGIATGPVVTGDRVREGEVEQTLAVGQTLHLAARLQALAEPDTVVITDTTRRLAGGLFVYADLGRQVLKGFPEPVQVWQVRQRQPAVNRFEAAHPARLPPLIGRRSELASLRQSWRSARHGMGRLLLLAGEAGIGKSRLVQALRERIPRADYHYLCNQCFAYYAHSPLHPLLVQLKRAIRPGGMDTPAAQLARLTALLERDGLDPTRVIPLLAPLLSLPGPALDLEPPRRHRLILQVLADWIGALAARRPLLLVFEDIHWSDPSSLELLTRLVEVLPGQRILLLCTFRPDFVPPWTGPTVRRLNMGRLNADQSAALARQVATQELPAATLAQIVAKTDGIPLFIEEYTHSLLNAAPDAVPVTLQDLLLARLDRLGPARTLAQLGAVLGREFSQSLLQAAADLPAAELERQLAQLLKTGLLQCHGEPPRRYLFRHALLRDAAYASLLHRRRRELHGRVAALLVQQFPQTSAEQPEIVAQHYSAAGAAGLAADYWLRAGQQAAARSANREAVSHLTHGLADLATLPATAERDCRELALRVALGPALLTTEGPGAPEVSAVYTHALALCDRLPDSPDHFAACWGWWRISPDFAVMRERADKLQALAENLRDPGLRLQAHHCQWATLFNLGDQPACYRHIRAGLALYADGDYRDHAARYGGHDPAVCANGEAALTLWLLGFPDQALARSRQTLALAERLNHTASRAHAVYATLVLHQYRRDVAAVQEFAGRIAALAQTQDSADLHSKSLIYQGWALAQRGQPVQGLERLREGLTMQRTIGTHEDFPAFIDMLAETCAQLGRYDEGLRELDTILAEAERCGIRYWLAELYRRKGELLGAAGKLAGADAAFRQALSIAEAQQVRMLALRAALSHARLRQGQRGNRERRRLAAIYAGFSEGHGCLDLRAARILLHGASVG